MLSLDIYVIEAASLTKCFTLNTQQIRAIDNQSFSIEKGQRVAVVGKSGSGKSTLLNLLAGLDRPTSGTLSVDGQCLERLSRNDMADYRLRTVGVVFQAFQLIPQRTALQNVELPLIMAGMRRAERILAAGEWLEKVGLTGRADHLPCTLSGGEQQRVAIARALVNAPRVVLADEPTGNLDSKTAADIIELLLQLCQESEITLLVVTHDDMLAQRCANRTLLMADGQLRDLSPST